MDNFDYLDFEPHASVFGMVAERDDISAARITANFKHEYPDGAGQPVHRLIPPGEVTSSIRSVLANLETAGLVEPSPATPDGWRCTAEGKRRYMDDAKTRGR